MENVIKRTIKFMKSKADFWEDKNLIELYASDGDERNDTNLCKLLCRIEEVGMITYRSMKTILSQ